MSATTIEASRIAGAIKALRALHHLDQVTEEEDYPSAYLDFYMQRLSRARAVIDQLGPMTPALEGAVSVFVEYVCEALDGGPPGLGSGYWTPLTAMTQEELKGYALDRQAEADALDAESTRVISLNERRAAR